MRSLKILTFVSAAGAALISLGSPALACEDGDCRQVFVPAHYETRTERVEEPGRWVIERREVEEPGRYETRYEDVRIPGRWERVQRRVGVSVGKVSVSFYETVWIPPRRERRAVQVYVPGCKRVEHVRVWKPGCSVEKPIQVYVQARWEVRCDGRAPGRGRGPGGRGQREGTVCRN